jgi:penicillin amidase
MSAKHSRRTHDRLAGIAVAAVVALALAPAAAVSAPESPLDVAGSDKAREQAVTRVAPGVAVLRDEWGVPHVFARTTFKLFYGYGYAVGQDRLFQMDMARRSATGRVAEVLGATYGDQDLVGFDVATRSNYTPASIRRQIRELPARDRAILEGYAAGLNAWTRRVQDNPDRLLPLQYTEFGFQPTRWTAFDVAMIFVGSMANRFSDTEVELSNLQLLQGLQDQHGEAIGTELFDQLRWRNDPTAPTTVPPGEGSGGDSRAAGGAGAAQQRLKPVSPAVGKAIRAQAEVTNTAATMPPLFSNVWLVNRDRAEGARSILLNGPQFAWNVPGYTYSVGLHGAGFDLVGNTPFAYPAVLFGHNRDIGWGSTAGFGNTVDVYQERLNPRNSRQYWFRNRWRDMRVRTETIKVKGGPDRTIEVLSTRHGLVRMIDEASDVAYSRARSWDGFEVQSLMGWTRQMQAENPRQWFRQAARNALTINWYYADRRGNIAYAHTGYYPDRVPDHDPRLPAIGTGGMEWRGIHPFSWNPKVLNPSTGYITNWNNKPARWYDNGDAATFAYADRVRVLIEMLEAEDRLDADEMWAINEPAAYADLYVQYFRPYIAAAVAGLPDSDPARRVADVIAAWDGQSRDRDDDGFYDEAATAAMHEWLPRLLQATLADELPDPARVPAAGQYLAPGYPNPAAMFNVGSVNLSPGLKAVVNALRGDESGVPQTYDVFNGVDPLDVIETTLRQAGDELGADTGAWRDTEPIAEFLLSHRNFWGIPQALAEEEINTGQELMNRGSENDLIIFRRRGVTDYEVTPPGQSGFVAPDGTRSPHYDDQLDMFIDFELKPIRLLPFG